MNVVRPLFWRCAGLGRVWLPLCGLAALAFGGEPPLRLGIALPAVEAALLLSVHGDASAPLTPARAERIALLQAGRVEAGAGEWQEVASERSWRDGALVWALPAGARTGPAGFFVARELPLPPAVTVSNATGLRAAVAAAVPGTRIQLAPGSYPGGFFFGGVRGEPGRPVVIAAADPAQPPVIQGGGNGFQFSDPEWLELENLVITSATGNGLNLDDGGSFDTPARHIVLRGLRISDVGPRGNRDGLKLSGVVDFRIEGCVIERWGDGGSAVDLVGCHRGLIVSNLFRHTPAAAAAGANGVQTKGGTREVVIRRNRFEHAGARGVNVGGSTGLEFFRPPLVPGAEHAEARDIRVEGNTFVGGTAAIAFVGVDGAEVRFNTISRPERWAIRILQETTAPGFVPCRNGRFTDNLVAFHSSQWFSGGVNVGPNTAPDSFDFARNWWYCLDQPAQSRPTLPVPEVGGVYGQSPQFRDAANGDLRLLPGSPASGYGAEGLTD
jgi:hypothetical protein